MLQLQIEVFYNVVRGPLDFPLPPEAKGIHTIHELVYRASHSVRTIFSDSQQKL